MFGHLNNNQLIFTKFPIHINNIDYFTTNRDILLQAGEKEIVYNSAPKAELGTYYISSWKENPTTIEQVWTLVTSEKDAILLKEYESRTQKYIAEKYTPSDETKITREYLAYGETHKQAFTEYNTYVEDCKKRAYKEVYGVDKPEEVK